MPAKPKTAKRRAKAPSAGTTKPSQFRLGDATLAVIDRIGRQWGGPVKPLDRTSVIREMARRTHIAEFGSEP